MASSPTVNRFRPWGDSSQLQNPIDFIARRTHLIDHQLPVYRALPGSMRGNWLVTAELVGYLEERGVSPKAIARVGYNDLGGEGPIYCSSYGDLERAFRGSGRARPLYMTEHGCGYSFSNRHAAFSGGRGLRRLVSAFLEVNHYTQNRNSEFYPWIRSEIVGCPKLDEPFRRRRAHNSTNPVVCTSTHWNAQICPETRSGWTWLKPALPRLAGEFRVIGHGHPLIFDSLVRQYESMGIEPVRSFDDVIERANVYITDGSSTLYEFAAVGGPVVTLNPPFYRRDVHHGLRWWAHADVGVQCNEVELLNECVREAICDKEPQQRARKAAIQDVYPNLGTATDRAIEFLKDLAKNGCDNSSQN